MSRSVLTASLLLPPLSQAAELTLELMPRFPLDLLVSIPTLPPLVLPGIGSTYLHHLRQTSTLDLDWVDVRDKCACPIRSGQDSTGQELK